MKRGHEQGSDTSLSTLVLGFLGIVGLGLAVMIFISFLASHEYKKDLGNAIRSYEQAVRGDSSAE